jgi:hypothetical protein
MEPSSEGVEALVDAGWGQTGDGDGVRRQTVCVSVGGAVSSSLSSS